MARILGPWGVIGWLAAHGDTKALAGAAFLIRQDIAVTCAHVIRDHLGLGSPTPSGAPTAKVVIRFEALEAEIAGQVLADGWLTPASGCIMFERVTSSRGREVCRDSFSLFSPGWR